MLAQFGRTKEEVVSGRQSRHHQYYFAMSDTKGRNYSAGGYRGVRLSKVPKNLPGVDVKDAKEIPEPHARHFWLKNFEKQVGFPPFPSVHKTLIFSLKDRGKRAALSGCTGRTIS
eukprot:836177-Amorphochlora_amoeboformis.AAC.1